MPTIAAVITSIAAAGGVGTTVAGARQTKKAARSQAAGVEAKARQEAARIESAEQMATEKGRKERIRRLRARTQLQQTQPGGDFAPQVTQKALLGT